MITFPTSRSRRVCEECGDGISKGDTYVRLPVQGIAKDKATCPICALSCLNVAMDTIKDRFPNAKIDRKNKRKSQTKREEEKQKVKNINRGISILDIL